MLVRIVVVQQFKSVFVVKVCLQFKICMQTEKFILFSNVLRVLEKVCCANLLYTFKLLGKLMLLGLFQQVNHLQ